MATGALTSMVKREDRNSVLVAAVSIVFAIGVAWGTLMIGIRDIRSDISTMNSRVTNIEKFLIPETHGKFVPGDTSSTERQQP